MAESSAERGPELDHGPAADHRSATNHGPAVQHGRLLEHRRERKRAAFEPAAALLGGDAQPSAPARRPLSTALGAVFVMLRALTGVLWLVAFALFWRDLAAELEIPRDASEVALITVLVVGGIFIVVLLLLAWLFWRGCNFARVLVLLGHTLSITTAAIGYFTAGEEITIQTTLLTVAFDILVLLALSSRDARAWARAKAQARQARRQATRRS